MFRPGNNTSNNCVVYSEFYYIIIESNPKNYSYFFNEVTKNIQEKIINKFDTTSIDNGDDFFVKFEKIAYSITTTRNQKKQINENKTIIDLSECETKLKEKYQIPEKESLYIFKIEFLVENIPRIEYEVYYNFSSNNLTKLNLTVCNGIKIDILIPKEIPINEIDKYNKNSRFYTDICYTLANSEIDISLADRRKEYENNNMSICEEDCDFTQYDSNTKKVKCSCFVKVNLPLISEIKFDKQKLISNFKDIRNIGNFKMLTCLKFFLKERNIFKNLSYYILIILLILSLISILTFRFHDYKMIKDFIYRNTMEINKKVINENIKTTNNEKNQIKNINNNLPNSNTYILKENKIKRKSIRKIKCKKKMQACNGYNFNNIHKGKINNINNEKIKSKEKLENIEIAYYFELNELEYEDALKKDNRTFLQLYISLIKTNHLFLFTFFYFKDYNSQAIKIFIFFFTFSMNLVVSAMFYSDETMHKIYIDKGKFDYTYQLPQMLYSFIISTILEKLLNLLGLYEPDIIEFKNDKNKFEKKEKILKKIKTKIILFFIIDYILIFFFWIYLGCFCYVYNKTQIHLLIDVASSFALSFISPLFIILISCSFRIISLQNKEGKRPVLFKLSNFIVNF